MFINRRGITKPDIINTKMPTLIKANNETQGLDYKDASDIRLCLVVLGIITPKIRSIG